MATARTKHVITGTGQTVGAATADLCVYTMPADTSVIADGHAVGKTSGEDTVGDGQRKLVKRVGTAAASIVGTALGLSGIADTAVLGASASVVVSGNDVILRATGVAGQTIDWFGDMTVWVN